MLPKHGPTLKILIVEGIKVGGELIVVNFIDAAQCLLDQLASILDQIGVDLATRPREGVQCVAIDVAGQEADNAAKDQVSVSRPRMPALRRRASRVGKGASRF